MSDWDGLDIGWEDKLRTPKRSFFYGRDGCCETNCLSVDEGCGSEGFSKSLFRSDIDWDSKRL